MERQELPCTAVPPVAFFLGGGQVVVEAVDLSCMHRQPMLCPWMQKTRETTSRHFPTNILTSRSVSSGPILGVHFTVSTKRMDHRF